MTWKGQVNKVLQRYTHGHLCVKCVSEMMPNLTLRQVDEILRSMVGSPNYVSTYEAACSRCGEVREVFACD